MTRYIAIFLCLFSFPVSLFANRINTPVNSAVRCVNISEEQCKAKRSRALARGWIDQEEYNTLVSYGAYPVCDEDGALQAWCPCGCFHPDSKISVYDISRGLTTQMNAFSIMENYRDYKLVHLDEALSKTGSFEHASSPIKMSTHGVETVPLIIIQTKDGRELKVTTRHPVLTARGEMILASEFKKEDGLLDFYGKKVDIASITSSLLKNNKEVVNFMVDKELSHKLEHVIFAENLAVGDLGWQSSLEDEQNQVILRQ